MFTKKTGRHYCTTFGVFKAASSPGISKCAECGKEHAPEEIQEAIYRAILEFNPYHDERGRFTSVGNATNVSVVAATRSKKSPASYQRAYHTVCKTDGTAQD
ncbi:hypothetical protein [Nitrososphaera sp.]|uniref:hypothetical protein n=1 Tax=Nitrososphaera sp. TaxID=1971748 RepID=UPI00307E51D7